MFHKLNLPVLVTVMCLILAGVITLAYLNNPRTNQKTKEVQINRTDYSRVAKKTLDWIDTQRGEDGWYILERGCDFKTKTCNIVWNNTEGNKDGLIATWARFNFYNQTKDPKDLEIVKKDINIFYNKYPNGVDNALWICKITYDMWQSKLFDQITKDKLEKICFNSQFLTPEEVKEQLAGKNKKENFNVNTLWNSWSTYTSMLRNINPVFGYTSDMFAKYLWKKDQAYLNLANNYLQITEDYYKNDSDILGDNACLIGLSKLDYYKNSNKDASDFDWINSLFNTISNKNDRKKYQTIFCGFFSKEIYLFTKDNVFLSGLENNNNLLISNCLDKDDSFSSVNNDYAFFDCSNGSLNFLYKSVLMNSVVVDLLRD